MPNAALSHAPTRNLTLTPDRNAPDAACPPLSQVTLPADVRRFLSYFRFGLSLGLSDTTSFLTCLGVGGFHWQLVLWMLVPPVLIGAILLCCVARLAYKRSFSRTALIESALPLVVRLLFLLYPLIAVSLPWLEPRTSRVGAELVP